jgi:tetratricopeptide (TPR) repeat protein
MMKTANSTLKTLNERLFSSTYQLQRIIILLGIILVVGIVSFGGYYYYDRYYSNQPTVKEQSIGQAEQAVRDDPQNADKRLALAETYMLNQRFDDALAQAQEVMNASPDNQHAWLVIGVANALKGNPQAALDPLQKYFDANKDADMPGLNKALQSAAYYLGDSYLKLNQPDKAIPVLEKDVEWSQTDADAMYKLGVAYIAIGRYADGVTVLQTATSFVPNYTEAYQAMATAFAAGNDADYLNYARGMVAYSQKQYSVALELLSKAAKGKPDFAPVFDGLGLTYEATGDLQNAKANYETAAKLVSDDFTASSGLQRVEALLNK